MCNVRIIDLLLFSDVLESNKNKTGFRKGHSTIDNIFVLHIIRTLQTTQKRNCFVAFVDFKKDF